jgi:hypothetical protein
MGGRSRLRRVSFCRALYHRERLRNYHTYSRIRKSLIAAIHTLRFFSANSPDSLLATVQLGDAALSAVTRARAALQEQTLHLDRPDLVAVIFTQRPRAPGAHYEQRGQPRAIKVIDNSMCSRVAWHNVYDVMFRAPLQYKLPVVLQITSHARAGRGWESSLRASGCGTGRVQPSSLGRLLARCDAAAVRTRPHTRRVKR